MWEETLIVISQQFAQFVVETLLLLLQFNSIALIRAADIYINEFAVLIEFKVSHLSHQTFWKVDMLSIYDLD